MKKIRFPILFLTLLLGCVPVNTGGPQQLAKKASTVFKKEFLVFYVPSSGSVADQTFIALSASTKTSAIASQLQVQLAGADKTETNIGVGGPNSAKTAIVIANALALNEARLSHLKLLFVGNREDSAAVEEAVNSAGGTFYFSQGTSR